MSSDIDPESVYGLEGNVDAGGARKAVCGHSHDHGTEGSNDHLALVYENQQEQFSTVIPFIRQGLEQGEQCLYVADDNTKDEVVNAFRDAGIDVDTLLNSGALTIHTKEETYHRTGEFDREAMIEFWEASLEQAQDQHDFEGIRAAAEMTWALDSGASLDYLIEYEALLNTVYPGENYTVLCQYNRNRFAPEVITDVIRTHPLVVSNNTVCQNFYYQPPEEFFGSDDPSPHSSQSAPRPPPDCHRSNVSAPLTQSPSASQPIRVLHVDDDAAFADTAAEFLTREDMIDTVVTATDASEALQRLDNEPVDCLVSDYDMPEMDGLAFLDAVREDYPNLPFILYTGEGNEEIAGEAITAGVTDYLQKGTGTEQYAILANRIRNCVEQYRADQTAVQTQQQYRRLIEESTDVITVIDDAGTFEYLSPAAERRLGYPADALVGEDWFDYIHPNDQDAITDQLATLNDQPDQRISVEFRFREPDGSWLWLEGRGRNLPVEDDREGIVVYARDITQRKRRERKLAQQNKRLEEFASVVSHDLRNPLKIVDGSLDLAEETGETEHFNRCRRGIDRMERLIDDLLTLARQGNSIEGLEPVDIADLVDDCWQMVVTDEASLQIETDHMIRADASRLQQLLENLIHNAVEHGGEDVTVTIGRLDNGFYIEDDGPGIPEDERDDVFDLGYTTAEQGSGFGLNIVQHIVEAHGWDIHVAGSEDGGARFEITGDRI